MFSFHDFLLFIVKAERVCLSFEEIAPKDSADLNLSLELYYNLRAELLKKFQGVFVVSEVERCEDCGAITVTNHVQVEANTLESAVEKVKDTFLQLDSEMDNLNIKKEKLDSLTIGEKYELKVEVDLEDGEDNESMLTEVVNICRAASGMIEISGFTPLYLVADYDEGPHFYDAFQEVKSVEIIQELVGEISDDPGSISFTLTFPHNFEYKFAIEVQSLGEVESKLEWFFRELFSRCDRSWDEFEKRVTVNHAN